MLSRKTVTILLFIMSLCLIAMSRCSDSPVKVPSVLVTGDTFPNLKPGPAERPAAKTITVSVSLKPEELSRIGQLKQQYESSHPGTRIQLDNVPENEAYDTYMKASALGDARDLMLMDNAWVAEFASRGFLKPIDSYYTGDQQSLQPETLVSQLKWNGTIWGVPKDVDPYGIVWNKALLTEKGFPSPGTGETLVAVLKALQGGERHSLQLVPTDPYAVATLLWTLGADWQNGKNEGPIGAQAVKLLEQLFPSSDNNGHAENGNQTKTVSKTGGSKDGKDAPQLYSIAAVSYEEAWSNVQSGKSAMIVAPLSLYRTMPQTGLEFTGIGTGIKESGEVKTGFWKGRSFVVSSKTTIPKDVYQLIAELTGKDAMARSGESGGRLPALNTSLEGVSPKGVSPSPDAGRVFRAEPQLPEKLRDLGQEADLLWKGQLSAKQFADRTNKRWLAAAH